MLDLGFLILLITLATGLGRRVVARLGGEPEHPADALALAAPVGLGLLALVVLGLGEIGFLTTGGIVAVLVVAAAIGGASGVRLMVGGGRDLATALRRPSFVDLALLVGVVGTLLTALAPVTDGDALCYHLQVPKVFLALGSVGFEPDLHETVYPLATELLYAVALALRGQVACRLVQWALGLIFALNVAALARPMLGDRARWAAAVALLTPAVSNGMGAPLNDVALAAFGNAALHAWLRWHSRPSARSAALAGLLAGLAIGVKYPGLAWAGLLGLAMPLATLLPPIPSFLRSAWECLNRRSASSPSESHLGPMLHPPHQAMGIGTHHPDDAERRERHSHAERRDEGEILRRVVSHTAIFATVAILTGGAWYARAYLHTGNPVFPFFRHTFGGSGLDEVLDPVSRPMAVNPWNVLTALVSMTLQPDRFDSLAHQFGPAFLLLLPGLALLKPPRRVAGIVALGWLFLTACVCVRQSMRFVLIATGPLAVGVAWAASAWRDKATPPAKILYAIFLAMLGAESLLATARARHGLNVVLGRETAETFLTRREPTYRVGRWIDAKLPASARLIGQDHRGFYIPRPYAMELAHRRRTGLGAKQESPAAIVEILRHRGFTHLLLCPPEPETAVEFDPTLSRRLAPWLAGHEPLYREAIVDPDGVTRRYAVYDLADPPALATRAHP